VVAAQSNSWVCGHSPAGILGSNPVESMDVSLFSELYVAGRGPCYGPIPPTDESTECGVLLGSI